MHALGDSAVAELDRRLNRGRNWTVVMSDTMTGGMNPRGSRSGRGGILPGFDSTDMVVWVNVQKDNNDSSYLTVSIRNATSGSAYGSQILQSARVKGPISVDQFRNTIRDAARMLEYLRMLPVGAPWPQSSVGRPSGPGGPTDRPSPDVPRNMEQFRRFDSTTVPQSPGTPSGG